MTDYEKQMQEELAAEEAAFRFAQVVCCIIIGLTALLVFIF
jgi:hypothetical protein